MIPFAEWRPDVADYEVQYTKTATNVVPRGDGYGPFLSFAAYTTALSAACKGFFYALKNDGSIAIFAATATKLYLLNNTNQTWTDVSLGGGTYSAPSTGRNWSFAQFNNFVFAVQANVAPQVFDLTSSTAFANLGGSPPQADYISVVNRFVVLSGIASPNVYRVQWSGLNATTTWDNVTNQSNFQDLADGGLVRGVAGGEYGLIFQDRSIRAMTYAPGSPYIFGIERLSKDDGLLAPYSLVQAAGMTFFLSPQGFKSFTPGALPTPIGKERVDRTFFGSVDLNHIELILGVADPNFQRVYWCYRSQSGTDSLFDSILAYDYVLDRWSSIKMSGEFLATLALAGMTLEAVDAAYDTGSPNTHSSISNASPAVFTTGSAHGLTAGKGIILKTTGTLPTGLSVDTPYYVIPTGLTSTQFEVSATGGVGAFVGSAVNTTGAGSGTHSYIVSSIETLSIGSLDSIAAGNLPQLGAVNSSNQIGYFTGQGMQATIETGEHGDAPRRIFVRGFRPITDASSCFGSMSTRENEQATPVYTSENTINAQGFIPLRQSTRYSRGRLRIPSGTTWTFASGVEPDIGAEGQR